VTRAYLRSRDGIVGEFSDRIDVLFDEWDRDGSPGAILAVCRDGKVIHQRGYGVANIEDDVPFTADTVLRLGSTTKHLCATCILLLENRGKLSLDDDIRQHVPEVPDFGPVITLRHLLTMTSGLWDDLNLLLFAGLDTGAPLTREQFLKLIPVQEQLMFNPGDDCTYSNTNYSLLSLVIERASGRPLAEFMQQELFEPLGMSDTRLTPWMKQTIPHKARGYQPAANGGIEAAYMMTELDGNGGVDSTVGDMLKWFLNYRDDRHFGPDYRRRLEAENRLNDGRLLDYRLGINVVDYRGMTVVRHAGGMPGYLCDFVFFPQADLGIVLLANVLAPRILELPDRIADIVLETAFDRPPETTFLDAGRDDLAPLLGVYASTEGGHVVELAEQGGKLVCYLLGDINPLCERDGWFESRKSLVSIRRADATAGRGGGLVLRLGCQPLHRLEPVADPRKEPAAPPPDWETFTGRYRLHGLNETHVVSLRNGRLRIEIPGPLRNLVWGDLTPVAGDLFVAPVEGEPSCTNVTVKFLRNDRGAVAALSYSINRCRDIVFRKQNDVRSDDESG
jgi:CubicO group peptidase (beta-lactamase class C family)